MSFYTACLPNYSVGEDCYQEIPAQMARFGKKAVVIGGKTAMSKAEKPLRDVLAGTDIELLDFIWFGGEASYENGNALMEMEAVQEADVIFGVGGGRACDTCKYVANEMNKPLFLFPTLASNCASVTAICMIYNPDGTFREYYYNKIADHTFINTDIIADSPYDYLWAGIGDTFAKEAEAFFSSKDDVLTHTPLMGVQLSRVCTEPLLLYGEEALQACKERTMTKALEEVALDIIISTGLVSNMTTKMPEYYYNSSLAHCVYNGSTITRNGRHHLHGEVVSLGVLCLLTYTKDEEKRERFMNFYHRVGLPVCFDDLEIGEDEFEDMAKKAMATTEWQFRPKDVTYEKFLQCLYGQNKAGREFKQRIKEIAR